jgi:class 3 adenylate cyclase
MDLPDTFPPSERGQFDSEFHTEFVKATQKRLKRSPEMDLLTLLSIWNYMSKTKKEGSAKLYELLGEKILDKGEPLLAYDVLSAGLEHWPQKVRLKQLTGLALAECGAIERGNLILLDLYENGNIDGETLGILARTYKDLWSLRKQPSRKLEALEKAHAYYYEGYQWATKSKKRSWLDEALYNGINAATTALLIGRQKQARNLARNVILICNRKLKRKKTDYWALATKGEAAIILKKWKEAEEFYCQAAQLEPKNYRRLSTTRRQARLLLAHFNLDRHRFDHYFNIPRIIVFAGYGIDQPDRTVSGFSAAAIGKARKEIAIRLKHLDAAISYSSAAYGFEILFLEEMLKRNGEINIVLPFPVKEFKKEYETIIPGTSWGQRFNRVLKKTARLIIASQHSYKGGGAFYEYANLLLDGHALLRAKMLDTKVEPLVVSDGREGDGPGGTASLIKHWQQHGMQPEVVNMAQLLNASVVSSKKSEPVISNLAVSGTTGKRSITVRHQIKAMLFADVVGYSQIADGKIPEFVEHFMGSIAALIENYKIKPLTKNTWGDALYFVFSSVDDACNFAYQLKKCIWRIDWEKKGLPGHLSLRISLHAGPVFRCLDPVTKRQKYTGAHVSRAARIEPITPPGEVYASQQFAALAAAQRIKSFRFDYVGQIPLPKMDGTEPLYLVDRLDPHNRLSL